MDEIVIFLLKSLGVNEWQLGVISKLRTVKELDNLLMNDETIFPLLQIGGTKRSKIVFRATTIPEYFQSDSLVELFKTYELNPSFVKDFSHHSSPNSNPLIYLLFSEDNPEEKIRHYVGLYVLKD